MLLFKASNTRRGKPLWGAVTGGSQLTDFCLHPGAEHGEPDILKDELQLYEGNCLGRNSGFGWNRIKERTQRLRASLGGNPVMRIFHELKVVGGYMRCGKVSGYNVGRWRWGQVFSTTADCARVYSDL